MKKLYAIDYYLLLYVVNCHAQNMENKDSVRSEKKSADVVVAVGTKDFPAFERDVSLDKISLSTQNSLRQPAIPSIQIAGQERVKIRSHFFTPYSYSFNSFMEGLTIKGFYGNLSFTDYLTVNINMHLSKTHFENNAQPYFYLNGSAKVELILKLHNRVQLIGVGQLSLREGFDPKVLSLISGSNYYGVGMQLKITNKIGIGVGFTNNYYHGEWARKNYIVPVEY